jgi:DNA-binding transcriptional regulator YdaS (Cro superfamily)
MQALEDGIAIIGSQSATARALGVSQAAVWGWLKRKKPLPDKHVLKMELETGIPRGVYRPDLYPDESGHDATRADDRRRTTESPDYGKMAPMR